MPVNPSKIPKNSLIIIQLNQIKKIPNNIEDVIAFIETSSEYDFLKNDIKNGQIIDPYDSQIKFSLINPKDGIEKDGKFYIWSFGPNKSDDKGSGDDIGNFKFMEFEPGNE